MFIPEWLLAVALTLFVLDIFVATEFLTWVSFATIAMYVTWRLDPSPLWTVLIFIGVFAVTASGYYFFGGRVLVRRVLAVTVLRGAPKETMERIVGEKGIVCWRNNQAFIRWEGELWPVDTTSGVTYPEGSVARVVSFHGGIATIECENVKAK